MARYNGPAPTIAELHRAHRWLWLHCHATGCHHRRAVTLVRYAIVWRWDASSDRLQRLSRCSRCGALGAVTFMPSFVDAVVGYQAWPSEADVIERGAHATLITRL